MTKLTLTSLVSGFHMLCFLFPEPWAFIAPVPGCALSGAKVLCSWVPSLFRPQSVMVLHPSPANQGPYLYVSTSCRALLPCTTPTIHILNSQGRNSLSSDKSCIFCIVSVCIQAPCWWRTVSFTIFLWKVNSPETCGRVESSVESGALEREWGITGWI